MAADRNNWSARTPPTGRNNERGGTCQSVSVVENEGIIHRPRIIIIIRRNGRPRTRVRYDLRVRANDGHDSLPPSTRKTVVRAINRWSTRARQRSLEYSKPVVDDFTRNGNDRENWRRYVRGNRPVLGFGARIIITLRPGRSFRSRPALFLSSRPLYAFGSIRTHRNFSFFLYDVIGNTLTGRNG